MTSSPGVVKSSYDVDVVRLIGQHLVGMGLKQTVEQLLEESGIQGLDHPLATRFQQHIIAGDWDKANSMVEELVDLAITTRQQQPLTSSTNHNQNQTTSSTQATNGSISSTAAPATATATTTNANTNIDADKTRCIREIRLAIAEQKFLELVEEYKPPLQALKCLRSEITPLSDDIKNVQHLATLLMCTSSEEIRLRANWPGKGLKSRQMLVEKLQHYIPPMILLPPKRLSTLLDQAIQLQIDRCALHIKQEDEIKQQQQQHNELCYLGTSPTMLASTNGRGCNNRAMMNNDNENNSSHQHQQQTNGYQTSSAPSSSTSLAANRCYDLKQDHVCSADRFPLQARQELDNHKTEVWFCKFSNDGAKLATGGLGGKVKIWNVDPLERKLMERCTLDCNSYSISCLSWSPNDNYLLACGSEDKPDLWIWNVNKEDIHNMIGHSDDGTPECTTTCSWHLSGEKFATASIKGNFYIYDIDGNRRGAREGVRVQCLSFLHKDPDYILAADTLNRIKSYAIKEMSLETEEEDILEERNAIMSFTVDKDDKYIAVNLMEQGIHLWDFRLKTLLRVFSGVCQRNLTIYSSFSSPDATFLASGSEDGRVYIYHTQKEKPVVILHGHTRCVNCVTWNPKYPELLVSVSDDRLVKLWAPR